MTDMTRDTLDSLAQTVTSRRAFRRAASLGAVGAGALVACGGKATAAERPPVPAAGGGHDMSTATTTPAVNARAAAESMDAMHEKGMKAFPAKTAVHGNQLRSTCHILPHAESEHGMFGMVTALVVAK